MKCFKSQRQKFWNWFCNITFLRWTSTQTQNIYCWIAGGPRSVKPTHWLEISSILWFRIFFFFLFFCLLFLSFSFWLAINFEENVLMYVTVCVCTLDMSELVDEVACLSDSTSEEHSLSSFTSESFDDNGKTHCALLNLRIFLLQHFILLHRLLPGEASKNKQQSEEREKKHMLCIFIVINKRGFPNVAVLLYASNVLKVNAQVVNGGKICFNSFLGIYRVSFFSDNSIPLIFSNDHVCVHVGACVCFSGRELTRCFVSCLISVAAEGKSPHASPTPWKDTYAHTHTYTTCTPTCCQGQHVSSLQFHVHTYLPCHTHYTHSPAHLSYTQHMKPYPIHKCTDIVSPLFPLFSVCVVPSLHCDSHTSGQRCRW